MKKSKKLSLVLMGAIALSSCGGGGSEPPQPTVFKDKAECVASGQYNEEQCAKMEADALANTPKFASREECVKQFGEEACKKEGGGTFGGGFWMPAMLGFMAGQMLGGMSQGAPQQGFDKDRRMAPGAPGAGGATSAQGLYQTPDGKGVQTATGQNVRPSSRSPLGRALGNTSRTAAPAGAMSRGGFSSGGRAIGA